MANIRDVNNLLCTGCSSCLNSCPVKAITIIQNKKGFYVRQKRLLCMTNKAYLSCK